MTTYKIEKYIGIIISTMHSKSLKNRLDNLSDAEFTDWYKEYFSAFDFSEMYECIKWALENPNYSFVDIPPGENKFSNSEIYSYLKLISIKLKSN